MVKKYLVNTKETFRVATVEEAEALNKEFKNDALNNDYELKSFSYVKKQVKAKGEVVDEYVVCTAVKVFNEEKNPESLLFEIQYVPDGSYYDNKQYNDDYKTNDLYSNQEEF